MSGDFDDMLGKQTAKKPKQSSKAEPKGDFDDMLDKQKLPEATGPTQGTDDISLFKQIQNAALKSGYSGLSDEHRLALDNALMNVKAQNPNAFSSIDDVHAQMDREAGVDIRSKVGRTLRTPLAGIVGTVEGAAGARGGAIGAQSGNRLDQAKEQGLNAALVS